MNKTLDWQIQQYLPRLGNDEKRSVLSVIKSFIMLREKQTVVEEDDIVSNIKADLEEVRQFEKGTLHTTPAKEFLDEI